MNIFKKNNIIKFQETNAEKLLYNFLNETKLAEALESLHELNYIARATENMFRYIKKIKHRKQLEDSDDLLVTMAEYHSTFMYNINVTVSTIFIVSKVKFSSNLCYISFLIFLTDLFNVFFFLFEILSNANSKT